MNKTEETTLIQVDTNQVVGQRIAVANSFFAGLRD